MTTDPPRLDAIWQPDPTPPVRLPTLHETLRAARALCDRAMLTATCGPEFDPATGWAYLDGAMAGLEGATDLSPGPADPPPQPIAPGTARAELYQLLRHAADLTLDLAEQLRTNGTLADLRAVADVAQQLPAVYQAIFGRPW